MDKHLTNLESEEHILDQVAKAQDAVTNAGEDPSAQAKANAALVHANLLAEGHRSTMSFIRQEHGDISIGEPRATKWRSVAQLRAQGLVGLYRV